MNEQMKLYELIQQYLNGELEGDALSNFELRIKNDKELASELNLHRAISKAIKPDEPQVLQLKKSLHKIRQEALENPSSSTSNNKIYWGLLALFFALGLVYLIMKPTENKSQPPAEKEELPLIAMASPENSLTTEALFSSMKGDNSNTFSKALDLYKKEEFDNSLKQLEQDSNSKINYDAQLLIGLNHLKLKKYEEALKVFDSFSQFDKRKVLDKSKWCLAITYMKMNRQKDYTATLKLIQKEGYFYPKEININQLINAKKE